MESPCIDAGDPNTNYIDPDGTRNDIGALPYFHDLPIAYKLNYGPTAFGDTVHSLTPEIYWSFIDTLPTSQQGYQIQVGTDDEWTIAELWNTGEIFSSDTYVVYSGDPLLNNTQYYLRIQLNNGIEWGGWREYQFYTHLQILNVPSEYLTIQSAIDASFEGDTILVASGIYYEHVSIGINIYLFSINGAENTVIQRLNDGFPIVTVESNIENGPEIAGFTIRNSVELPAIFIKSNSEPKIRSNIIENNSGNAILCLSISNAIIVNNNIKNNGLNGIAIESISNSIIDSNLIENNTGVGIGIQNGSNCQICNNSVFDNGNSGITMNGGEYIIRNNIVYNNADVGIQTTGHDINIISNTIDGNAAGIRCLYPDVCTIKNNIVTYSNGYGIQIYEMGSISILYNDVFGSGLGNYFGVLPDEGNISADPQFSNLPGNEYYLLSSSPCIDAGDPADPVPEGGGDRIDMGALEFTGLILDFSLLSPADSSVNFTYTPALQWEELPNNTEYGQLQYSLYLDTLANFANPIQYDVGTAATFTLPVALPDYGYWHWKVKAYNDTATFWSNEIFTFRIDYLPTIPSIISPQNGDSVTAIDWLVWTASYDGDTDDTVTYTLQIDDNADFMSPEVIQSGIVNSPTPPGGKVDLVGIMIESLTDYENLQNNTLYYWRVKAVDKFGGESAYSSGPSDFLYNPETTAPVAPTTPSIVSPFNGEEATPETWLIWNESYDPDPNDTVFYAIQIDNNTDFSSPEVIETGITDLAQPDKSIAGIVINLLQDYANLADDNTYYWRVKAMDKYDLESAFTDGTAYFMYNSVNSQPLPPTAGFAPSNDITTNNLLPTISWYPGTDPDPSDNSAALHYEIWIDDDGEFDTSIQFTYLTNLGVESVPLTDSLTDETHWDYMVRTIDDQGLESYWSDMQHFWTNSRNDTPMVFQANYPDNLIVHNMLPEFIWDESIETDPMDSVYYKFYLATDPNFQFVNIIDSLWDINYTRPDSLYFATQYWWKVKAIDNTGLTRFSTNVATFRTWRLGDVNNDWRFDILDIIFTIDYKFKNGAAPNPIYTGDVDGNCVVNILDIIYMINAKFKTGPDPLVGCE